VVRRDAEEVRTISDLAAHPGEWRAGFGYEFKERADGYPGLARAYGLEFADIRIMDLGLLYRALVEQKVDVVAGNATDGQIESLKLKVLVDDRGYFPPYEAAPVVRGVVLERYPKLAAALGGLGGRISVGAMRRMNYEVDGEHRDQAAVVRDFRTRGVLAGATAAQVSDVGDLNECWLVRAGADNVPLRSARSGGFGR